MARVGQLIGQRYRLQSLLGQDGIATTWLGHDEMQGRPVAVKEVPLPHGVDEQEREALHQRTLQVGRIAAGLNHPGVVSVYDVVSDEGRPYMVMESVPGHSLADEIAQFGTLAPERAAAIGLALVDALHAAHRAGLVHRDVKPANVLLATDGRVLLTDFGIALSEHDPASASTRQVIGSPAYMAPERLRGEPGGPPADLWSLGATLFAAVEGNPPFQGSTTARTIASILDDHVSPPLVKGPLREAVLGMLVKDPERRLDGSEARELLRQAAPQPLVQPFQTHSRGAGSRRPWPAASRDPGQQGATALQGAGHEVASASAESSTAWWDPSHGYAGNRPRRRSVALPAVLLLAVVALASTGLFLLSQLDLDSGPPGQSAGGRTPEGTASDPPSGTSTPTPAPFASPELLAFSRGLVDPEDCAEAGTGPQIVNAAPDVEAVQCEGPVYATTLFRKGSLAALRAERDLHRDSSVPGRVTPVAQPPTGAGSLVDGRRFFFVPPDGRLRLYWDSESCLCGGVIEAQDIDPLAAGRFWRGRVPEPFESRGLFEFARGLFAPMHCERPRPGERPVLEINPDVEAVHCDGPTYGANLFRKDTVEELDTERRLYLSRAVPASIGLVPDPPPEVVEQGNGSRFLFTPRDGQARLYWDSVACLCGGIIKAPDDDVDSLIAFWQNIS